MQPKGTVPNFSASCRMPLETLLYQYFLVDLSNLLSSLSQQNLKFFTTLQRRTAVSRQVRP